MLTEAAPNSTEVGAIVAVIAVVDVLECTPVTGGDHVVTVA